MLVKTKSIPSHQAKLAAAAKHAQRSAGAQGALAGISNKKFAQLSGPQKDALLKAIALRLELIEPDD